jgi:hypothetical protein
LIGFQPAWSAFRIAPEQDSGMDLNEPRVTALGLLMLGSDLKSLITHHSAPSGWGLFARQQLVQSEGGFFKWRTAEVPSDYESLGLKHFNMWD